VHIILSRIETATFSVAVGI